MFGVSYAQLVRCVLFSPLEGMSEKKENKPSTCSSLRGERTSAKCYSLLLMLLTRRGEAVVGVENTANILIVYCVGYSTSFL